MFITVLDYLLLPFYLGIIYAIAYNFRNRKYPKNHRWRKYFIPGLTVKIFGAIFIGLIYQYYYHGGDTSKYFTHAQVINSAFGESIGKWLKLLFRIPSLYDGNYYKYIIQMDWYGDPSSYSVVAITALISTFTFYTYLPAAVLFAVVSFSGTWALFRTFARVYPHLTRPIAIAILFIPSTFVWGSGIFKDTVCMFALGWLTYSIFRFMIERDFSLKNLVITILSFLLIAKVKLYILIGFIPALLIWILFFYSQRIRNAAGRFLLKAVFIGFALVGFLFFMRKFSADLGKYSLDRIVATSLSTSGWIFYASGDEGSAYDLGKFDPTIGGMISKFPLAVNVTLFRPYLWESKKIIVLLSALESILFLWLTLKIIVTVGIRKIWTTISRDPTIQFCLIFSVIFAFAVGISSYNFGALSRYKIPCLPFYALALILIYYKNKPLNKKLLPFL